MLQRLLNEHTHIHTHTHTYSHAHTYTHTHTHIHTHTHTHMHTHTHTYTHIHTHTHTYTHTQPITVEGEVFGGVMDSSKTRTVDYNFTSGTDCVIFGCYINSFGGKFSIPPLHCTIGESLSTVTHHWVPIIFLTDINEWLKHCFIQLVLLRFSCMYITLHTIVIFSFSQTLMNVIQR